MSAAAIVVFGVGSDASVDQFDGCRATRGIMLRRFLPDLDFPPFGFDVHRATIPDIPPIHLVGSAAAWGGNPDKDATYLNITPANNDGATVYKLSVRLKWIPDTPHQGFDNAAWYGFSADHVGYSQFVPRMEKAA